MVTLLGFFFEYVYKEIIKLRILGKNFDKGFFDGIPNKDIKELIIVNYVPLSSPCFALPLAICLSICNVLRFLPLASCLLLWLN